MTRAIEIAEIGALIGDPARANMLCALLDGAPHDATDLALSARVSPQTASWHLAQLVQGQLLLAEKQVVEKQGRGRLFRLASPLVAQLIEAAPTWLGATWVATGRHRRPTRCCERRRHASRAPVGIRT